MAFVMNQSKSLSWAFLRTLKSGGSQPKRIVEVIGRLRRFPRGLYTAKGNGSPPKLAAAKRFLILSHTRDISASRTLFGSYTPLPLGMACESQKAFRCSPEQNE